MELSPTYGAGQERLLTAQERRADPRTACSAGRAGGPLHAVLVTHPPKLLHAPRSSRAGASLGQPRGVPDRTTVATCHPLAPRESTAVQPESGRADRRRRGWQDSEGDRQIKRRA
jgi:hypothetical protein